jgi:putative GTP pyrophosphokinase
MALKDNQLQFSKKQIDEAGKILTNPQASSEETSQALLILNNFRTSHVHPINTFQATLRKKLKQLKLTNESRFLVSQRLKRTPSIIHKLERFPTFRLSQMQDVGGLRAILPTIKQVQNLVKAYKKISFQHEIKSEKDYINNPKDSGYRCHHIVYRYKNPSKPSCNGLMIELQIRTKLQHAWATAVETMGTFLQNSLKSSQGPEEWLHFFTLVGHAFSFIEETNPIPRYSNLSKQETFTRIKDQAHQLNIIEKLTAFQHAMSIPDEIQKRGRKGKFYLIRLDVNEKTVQIRSYSQQNLEKASEDYLREEAAIKNNLQGHSRQVVLVSSNSIESLKKAYPSYFLDTQEFIRQLTNIIKEAT